MSDPTISIRGPAQHEMRLRILDAAEERFRRHGYGRTTVAELANDLRVSTAYVYKFFPSKLAICEGVCGEVLTRIDEELWRIARSDAPPAKRLERLFQTLLAETVAMFFNERKLHDMVNEAMNNRWSSVERHKAAMRDTAAHIVQAGREQGVFESETPLPELSDAVFSTMVPFGHPKALEHSIQSGVDVAAHARWTAQLVLRGLRAV